MYVVVKTTCGDVVTYEVVGTQVFYLGAGDLHDTALDHLEVAGIFKVLEHVSRCEFSLHVYPTEAFCSKFLTKAPIQYLLL